LLATQRSKPSEGEFSTTELFRVPRINLDGGTDAPAPDRRQLEAFADQQSVNEAVQYIMSAMPPPARIAR